MHLSKRKGERRRRLKEGHGFGEKLLVEKVWWPVVGNFDFLHPEYEVVDEDGNYYYMDLAYLRGPKPADLESDGFIPHARDADRRIFSRGRRRQNAIALSGWNILRFSTDDIQDDPEYCRTTLRRMLEYWYCEERDEWSYLSLHQREIMRLAVRSSNSFTPADAAATLNATTKHARKLLHELVQTNFIEPVSGSRRITKYRLKQKKKAVQVVKASANSKRYSSPVD